MIAAPLTKAMPPQMPATITIRASLLPWQRDVATRARRFTVIAAGRRVGKTTLAAALALREAVAGGHVWWVAPTFGQAGIGWRAMLPVVRALPPTAVTVRVAERSLMFARGGSIRIRSADRVDLLRGEGLDFVVIDEAAYVDEEVWTAVLRPALADRRGRALFISTPAGDNWYRQLYMTAQLQRDWYAARYTTYDNPFISKNEIEAARQQLPDAVFRQEFLAEFVNDERTVFRNVDAVVDDALPCTPDAAHRPADAHIILACDIATEVDYTAIAIYDAARSALMAMDRFHRLDYPALVARIAALCERWRPEAVVIERNGVGQAVFDYLAQRQERVIGWTTTAQSKAQMIVALQTAFERRAIRLCRHDVLLAELRAFRSERSATGTMRYAAPPGGHDDCVMALAMAHWHAERSRYGAVIQVIR